MNLYHEEHQSYLDLLREAEKACWVLKVTNTAMDNLKEGDVIEKTESEYRHSNRYNPYCGTLTTALGYSPRCRRVETSVKRKVLFVMKPGLYVLSEKNNFDNVSTLYTAAEIRSNGYSSCKEEKVCELTVKQVSDKLGYPVKIIQ